MLHSLGKKFSEPKMTLGGKMTGSVQSLGSKFTPNIRKKQDRNPYEQKERHSPLER
jgi:hypothetical protein